MPAKSRLSLRFVSPSPTQKLFASLFFLLFLFSQHTFSQRILQGRVLDYFTNQAIADSTIQVILLSNDSIALDTAFVMVNINEYNHKRETNYYLVLDDKKEGNYILKCSHPNYRTEYVPQFIKFFKREETVRGKDIRLKRSIENTTELSEVFVNATKLKFYFSKDTLVYNAETFVTQYGLILNDLLHKMPGITVDDDYTIYSNGRIVDELLLNGKDFFNSDRETLIENLPAYMVKNIKIYEHADSIEMLKKDDMRPPLAMDIRLKKEYNSSFLGNVDLGVGTDKRYFTRAVAMRIHDLYRWAAFAGSNNTNHNEQINHNGQLYNMDNGSGDKKFHVAGINYNMEPQTEKFHLDGTFRIQGSRENQTQKLAERFFLKDGDIYDYVANNTDSRNFSVQTSHNLTLFPHKAYNLSISPAFCYIQTKTRLDKAMFESNTDITSFMPADWVDSIKAKPLGESLLMYGISRVSNQSYNPKYITQFSLNVNQSYQIPHTQDMLNLELSGLYNCQTNKAYTTYGIDYIADPSKLDTWKNIYNNNGNKTWNWGGKASYRIRLNQNNSIEVKPGYNHSYSSIDNSYYNLAAIDGWRIDTETMLGMLPSQILLMDVLDKNNSYKYNTYDDTYDLGLSYSISFHHKDLILSMPLRYQRKSLDFKQENNNQNIKRNMFSPDLNITLRKWMEGNTGYNYHVNLKIQKSMPALFNLVNQRNDIYDYMVSLGNPNLENMVHYSFNGSINWVTRVMQNHSFSVFYNYYHNGFSTVCLLDRETGHYSYMPKNVDGNQSFRTTLNNSIYLDKIYRHKLTNKIEYNYIKSVDYIGATIIEAAQKSTVHNSVISEKLEYGFSSKNTKYRGSLASFVTYHRSSSDRTGFNTINAYSYGLQASAHIELPLSFRLNTELRTESRRGYSDNSMNDNEVIWNLGIEKSFNDYITLTLNAVDLLDQRKSVYRVVTAQATKESVTNMLRRYVMLHFIWRFSKNKSKK